MSLSDVCVKKLVLLLALGLWLVTSPGFGQPTGRYTLIPRPAKLDARAGEFVVSQTTSVRVPLAQNAVKLLAETFVGQLNLTSGLNISLEEAGSTTNPARSPAGNLILFVPVADTTLGAEGYRIDVTARQLTVEAHQPAGFFYAVQSLYQLLPPAILGTVRNVVPLNPAIPACRIEDRPRYPYRGLHLDVSRHFFPVAFIKKYLDLMALYKFNTFHWHLTDDQGWRIEIKKYPKLTQVGARRKETVVGHYDDNDPLVFDGKPYGGFYTQDDVREVVRYAQSKFITVVPEIELPGHAQAALAAYPELGCADKPYAVATKWGVFADVFCPTETTFTFLENVLTEVMALFPGPYIHIGGDECPKSTWRQSAFCRQLMKRQRLKNADELQSYFIHRIDRFVTAKGRRIIGWDEILEGDGRDAALPAIRLSPSATVMCWRGTKGGIEAAKRGHDVVMTPDAFCYLNYYQSDPAQEPVAFGGDLPLSKVYGYDPTPAGLTPEQASHILGSQGNLWTEYVATPDQAEYQVWPRAAALAEAVWSPLGQKDYTDFSRRIPALFARLSSLHVNYARSFYDVTFTAKPAAVDKVMVALAGNPQTPEIRYTTDGSQPTAQSPRYTAPVLIDESATVRAVAFLNGQFAGPIRQKQISISKATGKPYTLVTRPITSRPDTGQLTNGLLAEFGGYELTEVLAFKNTTFSATLDLGEVQPVETVSVGFLSYTARDICPPNQVEVALSDDGITFGTSQTLLLEPAKGGKRGVERIEVSFPESTARYVRITAPTLGKVPAGLRHPGHVALLAVDEITVE